MKIEISCCYHCPHRKHDPMGPIDYCKLIGSAYKDCFPIDFDQTSGIWQECPLPDKE